jgi:hypothetical protein
MTSQMTSTVKSDLSARAESAQERAQQFRDQLSAVSRSAIEFCARLRGIATDGAALGHTLAAMQRACRNRFSKKKKKKKIEN